jgi:subtilisin family serine protease
VDLAAPGTSTLSTIPAFKAPEFSDTFETDFSQWVDDPLLGPLWSRVDPPGGATDFEMVDSDPGNYGLGDDNGVRTASAIDLTGEASCRVRFNLSRTLAVGDSLRLEASNGSGGPWAMLETWTGSGSEAVVRDLQGVDTSNFNTPYDFDGDADLYLRFRLIETSGTVADGAHVDDVFVECADPLAEAYGFKQGTSMAAPHVTGAAALVLAEHPAYTVAQLRAALLNTVDQKSALGCLVASGGRLNVNAAIQPGAGTSSPPPDNCPIVATPSPGEEPPRCAGKEATIVGTDKKNSIKGTNGADVIVAGGGADTVKGRGGNDRLCGGDGKDKLYGGPGTDRLIGGAAKDLQVQ